MSASLVALVLLAATPGVPLELPVLRAKLIEGDLVTIVRARTILAASGTEVDTGSLGLLDDLSRLMRCLPLGAIPERESARFRAARLAVRLERVRLERRLREGLYEGSSLDLLLAPVPPYSHRMPPVEPRLVRWPLEEERWPGEVPDPQLEPPACRPGPAPGLERHDPAVLSDHRKRAERELLAALVTASASLPDETRGAIALAVLADRPEGAPPLEEAGALAAALDRAPPPLRSAGRLLLARALDRAQQPALDHYRAVLADPSATVEEDSRARVFASVRLEPRWQEVLDVVRGARSPRTQDRPALANAEARALFGLEAWDELEAFGRRWLRERGALDALGFDAATEELLLRLALERDAGRAIAWIDELTPLGDRASRFDRTAKLALEEGRLDLTIALYDRLRVDAAAEVPRRGPTAVAELARWTAERALIEYETGDAAAFAGLLDDLLRLARDEAQRPLARTAPHRQVARLCQALLGRITNEAAEQPERRKYAAVLLEAIAALVREPSRWRPVLEDYREPLRILAGPWAAGRVPLLETPQKKRKTPPIRSLGEVVVPRLPPRLEPADVPTAVPVIDSFAVHEAPDGRLLAGPPWTPRARGAAGGEGSAIDP